MRTSFLIIPCHQKLATIAGLAVSKLFPQLEFLLSLKMLDGSPFQWEVMLMRKFSPFWDAANLAAYIAAAVQHKFRLRERRYDAEKVIEIMDQPSWKPRHLRRMRINMSGWPDFDEEHQNYFRTTLQMAGALTTTAHNQSRVVEVNTMGDPERMPKLFELVSRLQPSFNNVVAKNANK